MITLLLTLVPFVSAHTAGVQEAQGRAQRVEPDLEALRRELAEVRVALAADRAYAEAEGRLGALRERLVTRTDAEARTLLSELDLLAADVAQKLGRGTPDMVDQAALDAVADENWTFIDQLGSRAVPALIRSVRNDPEAFCEKSNDDPLLHLTRLAVMETDRLASELLPRGGFFWKTRLLRALRSSQFLGQVTAREGPDGARLRTGGILAALEQYLTDPDVRGPALELAGLVARNGVVVPGFEAALEDAALAHDPQRRQVAQSAAGHAADGIPELFERFLHAPEPELRILAIGVLPALQGKPELWALAARDPDVRVRRVVASGLLRGWPADPDAFLALLRDEDDEVRRLAWDYLVQQETSWDTVQVPPQEQLRGIEVRYERYRTGLPLPEEGLLTLLDLPQRSRLARLAPGLTAANCFRLLEALAQDDDAGVLVEVAGGLRKSPLHEDPEASMRVLDRLWNSPGSTLDVRQELEPVKVQLLRTVSGSRALLRWLVGRGDTEGVGRAMFDNRGRDRLFGLEAALLVDVLDLAYRTAPEKTRSDVLFQNYGGMEPFTQGQREAFLDLALDDARDAGLRLAVLRAAANLAGPTDRLVLAAHACLATLRESADSWGLTNDLVKAMKGLPEAARNELVLSAVLDLGLSDANAQLLVQGLAERAPGAAELCRAVLVRGEGQLEAWREGLGLVLNAMGRVATLEDRAFLERAARNPQLAPKALEAIRRIGVDGYLPLLTEIVRDPQSQEHLEEAAVALCNSLDVAAIEPILEAAKRAGPSVRDICIAQLEKIREYQDARERWATRQVKRQTREEVVAQLLAQLDSGQDEVRIEAARALATWEAVEAMPRLIELSATASKTVASAAKAALDRLNAPRGE